MQYQHDPNVSHLTSGAICLLLLLEVPTHPMIVHHPSDGHRGGSGGGEEGDVDQKRPGASSAGLGGAAGQDAQARAARGGLGGRSREGGICREL